MIKLSTGVPAASGLALAAYVGGWEGTAMVEAVGEFWLPIGYMVAVVLAVIGVTWALFKR